MGINNDIRPKTSYRYQPAHKHVPVENDTKPDSETDDPELDLATDHLSSFGKYEEEVKAEEGQSGSHDDGFFDGGPSHHHKEKEPVHTPHHKKMSRSSKILLWLLVLAVAGVLVFRNWDYLYHLVYPAKTVEKTETKYDSYTSTESPATTPTTSTPVTPAPTTPTPAPATTPTADKSFTVEVLNGNGISGSADKVGDALKAAGYNVTKVANAKSFSYASTYVYYKTGKETAASQIKAALSDRTCTLQLSNTITSSLYDIVVVVGTK